MGYSLKESSEKMDVGQKLRLIKNVREVTRPWFGPSLVRDFLGRGRLWLALKSWMLYSASLREMMQNAVNESF